MGCSGCNRDPVLKMVNTSCRLIGIILTFSFISMLYLTGYEHPYRLLVLQQSTNDSSTGTSLPEVQKGYLVWSEKCRIPDIDPHHESIRKLIKAAESVVCSRYGPLTYIRRDPDYALILDSGVKPRYVSSGKGELKCCYANITRPEPKSNSTTADDDISMSHCEAFEDEVQLGPSSEFILVKCTVKGKEVYSNVHFTIPPTKIKKLHKDSGRRPSVLLLGIDAMSRLNLIRTMPRTVNHLRRQGWLELRGYNKVGDNTFPNVVPILTGMEMEQFKNVCWPHTRTSFIEDCPLIWDDFSSKGYVTVFGEDMPAISTFNYQKKGFRTPPTDLYLRPLMVAAEANLKIKKRDGLNICLGPTLTVDIILRYTSELYAKVAPSGSFFAFLWTNSFSHNNHNTPSALDYRFLRFFAEELPEVGLLNNTIVFFFSDHGMRFGKIRETFVGWLEERLPFHYIWIPEWYRKEHPRLFKNLQINGDRLTSPYDLHATLVDILDTSSPSTQATVKSDKHNSSEFCTKCASLFEEVPRDRSCEDAGISSHWCTCTEYRTLSTKDTDAQEAAKYVLKEIQWRLRGYTNLCANLTLSRLVNVRGKIHAVQDKHKDYVVMFETSPGGALFEATVRRSASQFKVLGIISRINSYQGQSSCISHAVLKMYCYCKDLLNARST